MYISNGLWLEVFLVYDMFMLYHFVMYVYSQRYISIIPRDIFYLWPHVYVSDKVIYVHMHSHQPTH